jgi:hypothetical protein
MNRERNGLSQATLCIVCKVATLVMQGCRTSQGKRCDFYIHVYGHMRWNTQHDKGGCGLSYSEG